MSYTPIISSQPGDYVMYLGASNPMQYQFAVLWAPGDSPPQYYNLELLLDGVTLINLPISPAGTTDFFGLNITQFGVDLSMYVRENIGSPSILVGGGILPECLKRVSVEMTLFVENLITGYVAYEAAGDLACADVWAIRGAVDAYRSVSYRINDQGGAFYAGYADPLTNKPLESNISPVSLEYQSFIQSTDSTINSIAVFTVDGNGDIQSGSVWGMPSMASADPQYITVPCSPNAGFGTSSLLSGSFIFNDQTAYYLFYYGWWSGGFTIRSAEYRRNIAPDYLADVHFINQEGATDMITMVGNRFEYTDVLSDSVNLDNPTPFYADDTVIPALRGRQLVNITAGQRIRFWQNKSMAESQWLAELMASPAVTLHNLNSVTRSPDFWACNIRPISYLNYQTTKLEFPMLDFELELAQQIPTLA